MLSGPEIRRQRELGNIVIEPWDEANLGPNSYDLRLGPELLTYEVDGNPPYTPGDYSRPITWNDVLGGAASWSEPRRRWELDLVEQKMFRKHAFSVLDMARENPVDRFEIPDYGYVLEPGRLYLGSTAERTETRGFVPVIETRSSVARLGMTVHLSAGFGEDGFEGHWTLEIIVIHPLRVYAGVRVCQIAYDELVGERSPYKGKYQGQSGPQASRLYRDFESRPDAGGGTP